MLCDQFLNIENFHNSTDLVSDFTSSLIDISDKCIPKTSTNPKKINPWYNDDCKEAIRQRKHALSKFCKYPTKENLKDVKVNRPKARATIKSAKRKTWKSYVSKLNYKTPVKKVWDMVRKIFGKSKSPTYTHLNTCREKKLQIRKTLQIHLEELSCEIRRHKIIQKNSNILKNIKKKIKLILNL